MLIEDGTIGNYQAASASHSAKEKALTQAVRAFSIFQVCPQPLLNRTGPTTLGGQTGCREGEIVGASTGRTAQGGRTGATTLNVRKDKGTGNQGRS